MNQTGYQDHIGSIQPIKKSPIQNKLSSCTNKLRTQAIDWHVQPQISMNLNNNKERAR